jgi:tetratricopeptide (TPR) repeat protein
MNLGDERLGKEQVEEALAAYRAAASLTPQIEEMPFWHAVTLADMGRVEEALPLFRQVFQVNPNWKILLPRLPRAGLLRDDPDLLKRILE